MIITLNEMDWEDGYSQSIISALITVDGEWEVIRISEEVH